MAQLRSGSIFARRRLGGHPPPTRFWEGSPAATVLDEVSRARADTALRMLASDPRGLSEVEVQRRLRTYGPNEVAHERPVSWPTMLLHNFKNPFVVVLAVLGLVSYVTEDTKGTIVVAVMVALSVLTRFIQEFRSSRAAQVLRAMVSTTATVTRRCTSGSEDGAGEIVSQKREIRFDELVPGDVVHLSAGDMLPADVRFLSSKDLFVSQAALTGEAMPVEKYDTLSTVAEREVADRSGPADGNPLDRPTLGFMGTNVLGGSATAVVVATGQRTYFGSLAKSVIGHRSLTSFDKGVNRVTWVLIRFMLVMVPVVFLINGLAKGNWVEAFLFATAVAVGLTPEMLPMVVTANLARGAVALARQKVIVKRLNAIQNFGAMDILCTDKTGTLTQDRIVLEEHLDLQGREDHRVLEYAYLNSYHQTGLKNLLDRAILAHGELEHELHIASDYVKVDEVPFDFARRRMSVVVEQEHKQHLLICKGAVEEVLEISSWAEEVHEVAPLGQDLRDRVVALTQSLNENGFRVVAVAYKTMPATDRTYSVDDERDLVVMGLIAFLDPQKGTAPQAIAALHGHGVAVKILTGDNEIVTRRICRHVGLPIDTIVRGTDLEGLGAEAIENLAERATVFAKLTPLQKARIVRALQARGHTVGFLGDGINDAAALRDADVGISVDGATDIARESADLILLEKSLLVLEAGVLKGREVYGNIIKYIKMTASSNFGNVFSVLIASAFLPFLPMLPLQLLVQNLLYDLSQLALPWDRMDREFLEKPRTWEPIGIARFMVFIGPISSVFDVATFLVLWFVLRANGPAHQGLFQSGWFIEGLLSQTLIVHMIRTQRIPFLQSIAAAAVLVSTASIMAIGIGLPFSHAGAALGMVSLPWAYFSWLAVILIGYCGLTQTVKVWYLRRFGSWL